MRALIDVAPSAEQLSLFSRIQKSGIEVIRGAAGSGKTTTALLKLRSSVGSFVRRQQRKENPDPVRILLLTYNRTLSGYVAELASKQVAEDKLIQLEVSTFGKWAMTALNEPRVLDYRETEILLQGLGKGLGLPEDFIAEEMDYLLGRFMPENISEYLTARRDGRGGTPRMERSTREAFLQDVVDPYIKLKNTAGIRDWNDLAVEMARNQILAYDIVIVDEAQDFSANQIRAVVNQLNKEHSVTFVLDTAQRIYARGFTWHEVGITVRPENSFRLSNNYRNTKEIAAFAVSLLSGIATDDDGTLPNFAGASRSGEKPVVLKGIYRNQLTYAVDFIKNKVDLSSESVAFLHPKGGRWFDWTRSQLNAANLPFVEITRASEWPTGPENIALSTLHSAKGLEFDHVFILGLNAQVLPHGEEEDDDRLTMLRRLLAMGIGRARQTVTIGFKTEDVSELVKYLNTKTYNEVVL